MRYHFVKPIIFSNLYGDTYTCDHEIYSRSTLYQMGNKGLCVVQQQFNASTKSTYWDEVDPCLRDALYLNPGFYEYFKANASESVDGIFPTVTLRQIMWALRMKPLKKERWETMFDRHFV